jgi:nitrite reductase/ring-hydroxylating ferredoxin subunit
MLEAPSAEAFATVPRGWYVFGDVPANRPVSRTLPWGEVVCWRTPGGLAATAARCWHMGADLGGGEVVDGCVSCPFHGWQFGADGRCAAQPAARLETFAVAEAEGRVYVAPTAEPPCAVPTFGLDLVSAPAFSFDVACPYWLVGGNGFDAAHFRYAHDRRLVGEPTVSSPHPLARRIVATFEVTGDDVRDRLLRLAAGGRVTLDATVWGGTLALVRSTFRRSQTFGLVELRPIDSCTRVTVWIHVRRQLGAAALARVRTNFVRAFLAPDVALLQGARYHPDRLTAGDRILTDYFRWLAPATHGET